MTAVGAPSDRLSRVRLSAAAVGKALRRIPPKRLALCGAIALLLLLMVIGPHIGPWGPEEVDHNANLTAPNASHWFGTDRNGMDIFSRILAAPRINLSIALAATTISIAIGVPLGAAAGFFGGRGRVGGMSSELMMRLMDVLQSFPVFIFALVLVAVRGPATENVVAALALVNLPVFVRLARADMLAVREQPYAEAARCLGHSNTRIIFRHLLPNALASSLAQVPVVIGFVILFTASLSFVGAGVRPPTPELGAMIAIGGKNMITGQAWPSLFPGIALGLIVLVFALAAADLGQHIQRVRRGSGAGMLTAGPLGAAVATRA
jgi:peptide/nickel transport system permease protein